MTQRRACRLTQRSGGELIGLAYAYQQQPLGLQARRAMQERHVQRLSGEFFRFVEFPRQAGPERGWSSKAY